MPDFAMPMGQVGGAISSLRTANKCRFIAAPSQGVMSANGVARLPPVFPMSPRQRAKCLHQRLPIDESTLIYTGVMDRL